MYVHVRVYRGGANSRDGRGRRSRLCLDVYTRVGERRAEERGHTTGRTLMLHACYTPSFSRRRPSRSPFPSLRSPAPRTEAARAARAARRERWLLLSIPSLPSPHPSSPADRSFLSSGLSSARTLRSHSQSRLFIFFSFTKTCSNSTRLGCSMTVSVLSTMLPRSVVIWSS